MKVISVSLKLTAESKNVIICHCFHLVLHFDRKLTDELILTLRTWRLSPWATASMCKPKLSKRGSRKIVILDHCSASYATTMYLHNSPTI